jgi:hypothetical protein
MEVKTISVAALQNDDDGVCAAQDPAGAGNLTIAGALATGGVATLTTAQKLTVTSAGDDTLINFTFTGTDADGAAVTEVLAGANAGAAVTTKHYKTVTQIAVSGNSSSVKVGPVAASGGAVSTTLELNVNQYGDDFKYMASVDIGAGTYSLQGSMDEKSTAQEDSTWYAFTSFSGVTADVAALLAFPARKVRFIWTSYTSGTARAVIGVRGKEFV